MFYKDLKIEGRSPFDVKEMIISRQIRFLQLLWLKYFQNETKNHDFLRQVWYSTEHKAQRRKRAKIYKVICEIPVS